MHTDPQQPDGQQLGPQQSDPQQPIARNHPPAWRGWALFAVALLTTFLLGILAASILQRREEARRQAPLRPIDAMETDSNVWGKNFPRQYDTYLQMKDSSTRTRFGGADPRDLLAETPANVILFAGYGFAKEYRQGRGHLYAIQDVLHTKRIRPTTSGTCWTCKSPDALRLIDEMGAERFYAGNFHDLKEDMIRPIGCLDCHDPKTMELRVARPALSEAFRRRGDDLQQVQPDRVQYLRVYREGIDAVVPKSRGRQGPQQLLVQKDLVLR